MSVTITSLTDYEIGDKIHESEHTVVYRGQTQADAQPVIIKLMRNEFPSFHELVQFRNQYTIARNLQIEGIVRPLALERYQNRYALIMEDFGGIALGEYYQNLPHQTKDIPQFLDIAIQITEIIYQLHQHRIIHKDIKPANIVINPESQQVKLIDFSISTLLPKESQTIQTPNVLEGTLAYISPEQTGRMNRGIDYRSDFYSLGVTFFELLNGKLPFETTDLMELVHCHIAKPPPTCDSRLPTPLVDIVLKLMAKNAEDRYQSALGLKSDLEKCLCQWQEKGKIEAFELGERDISDRFLIPEKLYGRETEVQTLLNAFERVASPLGKGGAEMMLVAGFSGIGKTAVVNEVHKPIVEKRGYFIKGKFDQFQRNIPFSAFVQAFRDLMGQLLGESDAQLQRWKDKILSALGENGQVIIDVIPELETIIGQQPPVPELEGSAAQNRFNLLFEKFVGAIAKPEHPLTIFIDDLQWADSASLNLLKLLMDESEGGYLFVLGAYRDNEVFPAHPLMLTLEEMQKQGATVNTLTLAPLDEADITRLVADTLLCSVDIAAPLSGLVYQKTQGNPFFTTQFLQGLHEDGWITFEVDVGYWQCNLTQVRQLALTDDVVEFMMGRLQKLPEVTQNVLKLAACIGNQFDLGTLAVVCECSQEEVANNLWRGLQEGFVIPESETYKLFQGEQDADKGLEAVSVAYRFLHDRVQQAAYSLIPDGQKEMTHYHIGQLLLQQIPLETREERIFELVNQLNYGTALIAEQSERDELAKLNLIACRKARAAIAYQTGHEYVNTGLSLLGENPWQRQYEMSLAFHDLGAELTSLCGDFEGMEQFVETVIAQASTLLEQVNVYRIRMQSNIFQTKFAEAIAIGREVLQQLGIDFPETPTQKDIQAAFTEIGQLIEDRQIEDLLNLPMMTEAEIIAIMRIANSIIAAAYVSGSLLFPLLVALSVKLSIQYGNTPASAFAYVCYGIIACNMQDVDTGVKWGQLALGVVSQLDAKAFKPEVLMVVGLFILHRQSHLKETLPLLQEGYAAALEVGNLEHAGYNAVGFCLSSFWCSHPLASLEQETRAYCHALLQLNQLTTANRVRISWQSILNLRGVTKHPSILSGEALQETEFLPLLISAHDLWGLHFFYLHKLMLCYLFGEIESARDHALEVKRYLMGAPGAVGEPTFYFYDSLTALAALSSQAGETSEGLQQVEQNQMQLQEYWAHYAPINYQHKVDLVEAEKCRVLGEKLEAIELYDKAIAGAKENEYIQEEALANELAAKFYLDWGKDKIAATYMQEAYYGYARWGAKAKADDLEQRYPQLLAPILERQKLCLSSSATIANLTRGTISCTATRTGELLLDLASLMKAFHTLSEEIELERAIANLMQVVMENAGAETVALMLLKEQVLMLTALLTSEDAPELNPIPVEASNAVPMSIVNKVKRSQKPVVLDNASQETAYLGDTYIRLSQPQSILCVPLIARGQLIGILYLENNQCTGAFTRERVELLNLLCSQAAISLENARLYQESQNYAQQLEKTQLQLVQSEKMASIGELAAGVAHEINNPVGFISGNLTFASNYSKDLIEILQLYQAELPDPSEIILQKIESSELDYLIEDLPPTINSMKQSIERIAEISKSMRIFSRGDIAKVPFNIHDGIDSTLLILKHRLKANQKRPKIEVVKNYGDLPEIQCYPGQLNQVLMNILANAIDVLDETSEGKTYAEIEANNNRISISTEFNPEQNIALVGITDNGKGMSPEVRSRIFDQGFTTKAVGKGTGLGMAISKQIIEEKHQGKINCISELGKGTKFVISLPLS